MILVSAKRLNKNKKHLASGELEELSINIEIQVIQHLLQSYGERITRTDDTQDQSAFIDNEELMIKAFKEKAIERVADPELFVVSNPLVLKNLKADLCDEQVEVIDDIIEESQEPDKEDVLRIHKEDFEKIKAKLDQLRPMLLSLGDDYNHKQHLSYAQLYDVVSDDVYDVIDIVHPDISLENPIYKGEAS